VEFFFYLDYVNFRNLVVLQLSTPKITDDDLYFIIVERCNFHKNNISDCIREFLCIASHSQKFFLRETGDVLYRSAATKRDFSGYKAATGWNAIQLYAGNLLSQPWRKEYRQVKVPLLLLLLSEL
jgi:hypothetical protein